MRVTESRHLVSFALPLGVIISEMWSATPPSIRRGHLNAAGSVNRRYCFTASATVAAAAR